MSLYMVPGYGGGALTVNESPLSNGFSAKPGADHG